MQPLPVTVDKHWAGQLGIFLLGVAGLGLVFWALLESYRTPWADPLIMFSLSVLLVAFIVAFTAVWLRVYSLSYFTLTPEGIVVVQWNSLFHSQKTVTEWSDVEDASSVKSGIFAQLLPFGTVNVQTAGTIQNLRLTMAPNPDYWVEVINYYQDQSTPNV